MFLASCRSLTRTSKADCTQVRDIAAVASFEHWHITPEDRIPLPDVAYRSSMPTGILRRLPSRINHLGIARLPKLCPTQSTSLVQTDLAANATLVLVLHFRLRVSARPAPPSDTFVAYRVPLPRSAVHPVQTNKNNPQYHLDCRLSL
jgi:hypothetical protein